MDFADRKVGVIGAIPHTPLETRLVDVFPSSMEVVRISEETVYRGNNGDAAPFGDPVASFSHIEPIVLFIVCPCGAFVQAQGLTVKIRELAPGAVLLLATECASPDEVFKLLELQVDDFVTSPFRPADILPRLWRLVGNMYTERATVNRRETKMKLDNIVGASPRFLDIVERLSSIAEHDTTVLIGGETGTGKEVFARAIHDLSPRASGPFVPVNCGAIPLELLENELFGHERAAFTNAVSSHLGLIHEAEGGTLFLDEVDCLPPTAQVKLLRFLQEKEYRPLGSRKTLSADLRLIVASNADLDSAVRCGRLRHDFYYRINVLPLTLPPLRERLQDVQLLARHFLKKFAAELHRPVPILLPEAERALLHYSWPGNVRELEHIIERAVVLAEDRKVISGREIILPCTSEAEPDSFQRAKARTVSEFERSYIESLLLAHNGNISQAARVAGKNRRAFWELIRKHRIDAERFRSAAHEVND